MATPLPKAITIRIHKPSLSEQLFFLVSGIIVSVPLTLFIENFAFLPLFSFLPIDPLVISSLILAPLVEEFAKAYPLFYRHGETERSFFTLGFLVGFGFGLAEFTIYVLSGVPIYDRIFGVFFHAATTCIVAYGIAQKQALSYYLIAVLLHFSVNLSSYVGFFWLSGILATGLTFFVSWSLYNKTSERIVN